MTDNTLEAELTPRVNSALGNLAVIDSVAIDTVEEAQFWDTELDKVRTALDLIDSEIGPVKSAAWDTHKRIVALEKKLKAGPLRAKQLIGRAIADHDTRRRREIAEKARQERAAQQAAAEAEAERIRQETIDELVDAGRDDEAMAMMDGGIDDSLIVAPPPSAPVKVQPSDVGLAHTSFTYKPNFEVLDLLRVKDEFKVVTINKPAVMGVLRGDYDNAERVVGKGGIRVFKNKVPRKRR